MHKCELYQQTKQRIFSAKIFNKFPIKFVTAKEYWDFYESSFQVHDPSSAGLYFNPEKLSDPKLQQILLDCDNRLHKFNMDYSDYFFLLDEDETAVIGMFWGKQVKFDTYITQHSVIHSQYRRLGLYSEFIKRILNFTKEIGFHKVIGSHSPSNNSVIIAKLKIGFHVTSMEISPEWGIELYMTYFHYEDMKRAFALRCGDIEMSKNLVNSSQGSADRLAKLILACQSE